MNPADPPRPPDPATSSLGLAALGITDPTFTARAHHAVSLLLDAVHDVLNDAETFSEALAGGGEFVCKHLGLDPSFAPFIEAETARLVAGLQPSKLHALALPAVLAAIDQQPLETQQALVEEAAARHHVSAPAPAERRAAAALAKSPHHAPGLDTASRTAAVAPRLTPAHIPSAETSRAAPRARR